MLELKNITKDYPTGAEAVHALKGISINFRESEFVSILGQSGCGKTTVARMIVRLLEPTSGEIIFKGEDLLHFRGSRLHCFPAGVSAIRFIRFSNTKRRNPFKHGGTDKGDWRPGPAVTLAVSMYYRVNSCF